jgi:hypothetical protein
LRSATLLFAVLSLYNDDTAGATSNSTPSRQKRRPGTIRYLRNAFAPVVAAT